MNSIKMIGALAALTLLSVPEASAKGPIFTSGEKLNEDCQQYRRNGNGQPASNVGVTMCMGFVNGVVDQLSSENQNDICLPQSSITIGTLTDVVAQYLDQHPEARQYVGIKVVYSALAKSYPCPK